MPSLGTAGLAALALRVLEDGRQAFALLEGAHPATARIAHLNTAFSRMTGFTVETARGRTLQQLLCPDPGLFEWSWAKDATHPGQVHAALPCLRHDRSNFVGDLHVFSLGGDTPTGYWAAQLADISDQLKLHEDLWRNENIQHLLADNIRDLITVWGHDGRCLFASPSSTAMIGRTPSEIVGMNLTELVHPEEMLSIASALSRHFGKPKQTQHVHRLRHADGSFIWVESVTKSRVRAGTDRPMDVVVTTRDISKRHAAEESLRQVHGLLASIYDAVPIGLCLMDGRDMINQTNRAFCELFKVPQNGVNGQPAHEFIKQRDLIRAAQAGGLPVECECVDGDGQNFPAEITVILLEKDFSRLVVISDVRDRRRVLEQLQDSRRLESLGTLAGGIAHDFNNMLAIILGYASMLRDAANDPPRLAHYADTIMDAGRRGAEVVRQLQLFANTQEADTIPTDVHALLDDIIDQSTATWPGKVVVEKRYDAQDSVVVVDPLQFAQAIEKLLDNAHNAIASGGTITVRTTEIRQASFTPGAASAETKSFLRITIQDSGRGMDAATRARMFDPFFARHKGSEARGLGLAVVYGIVRAHRGVIEVESMLGQGTSVHVLLPRTTVAEPVVAEPATQVTLERRTILLVEDEQDLGALWSEVLTNKGWTVLWARDGEEAVNLFRQHQDSITLVFTDIGLPLMDGWEVAAQIRAERSDVPLLITSGAFGNGDQQRDLAPPVHYLPKPYLHTKVLAQIEEMVGTPS